MGWENVVHGGARYSVQQGDALDVLRSMPDRSIQLTLFSPPYSKQRTYSIGFNLKGQAWVDWLRRIVVEACRVTDGLVVVNAAGEVEDHRYSPIVEWLVADLTRHDGLVCGPAPWCWWKVAGTPGSGHKRYQRRDWEPLYGFCLPDRLPLTGTNNTWGGNPPKWNPGGEMSHRLPDGRRRNERESEKAKREHTKRVTTGGADVLRVQTYRPPSISNPGNVIRAEEPEPLALDDGGQVIEARVGGNALGSKLAHASEAPMAMKVAERIVNWYCPPRGIVGDFFVGSGTTVHAALNHGRRAIGVDIRQSQVDLALRRVLGTTPSLFDLDDGPPAGTDTTADRAGAVCENTEPEHAD